MNNKNYYFPRVISLLPLVILLTACGSSKTEGEKIESRQPHQIGARNAQAVDILERETFSAPVITTNATSITITTHLGPQAATNDHYQLYLNTDNNTKTGYQFKNEAWDNAGVDYIVEDGHLFKSRNQGSTWDWNANIGDVIYKRTDNSISITIDQSLLKNLGPIVRLGFMKRDTNWDINAIYPRSGLMSSFSINVPPPTEDETPPTITLNGSQVMTVLLNSDFVDLGAKAKDNIDGEISSSIISNSNVDISTLGTYNIRYEITDRAGNEANITRTVIVAEKLTGNISIDGQDNDWANIPELVSNSAGSIKVTDKDNQLYILINANEKAENTQIFLDTDNNTTTGYQFNSDIWSQNSADYMVENSSLSYSKAKEFWSWDYNIASSDFIKNGNIIEMAIPKSALKNLGKNLKIGFVGRDKDWNVLSVLPESGMKEYQLQQTPDLAFANIPVPFCNALWETDGTSSNSNLLAKYTLTSKMLKHNTYWYGIAKNQTNASERVILQYDGSDIKEVASIKASNIQQLSFVGNTLYFIVDGKLWVKKDNTEAHEVAGFTNVRELKKANDYLLAVEVSSSSDSHSFYRINQDDSHQLLASFIPSKNRISLLFTHKNDTYIKLESYADRTVEFIKLNGAPTSSEVVSYKPIASFQGGFYYSKTNSNDETSLWIQENNTDRLLVNNFNLYLESQLGALYFRGTTRNTAPKRDTKDYYRLNETDGNMKLVTSISIPKGMAKAAIMQGLYFINNVDYYYTSQSDRFQTSKRLKKVIDDTSEFIVGGRSGKYGTQTPLGVMYIDGKLLFSAYTHNPLTYYIGMVDKSGVLKNLAPCHR